MTQHDTLNLKGETYILVPRAEFETMTDALDDRLDARAARRALAELEGREGDLLSKDDLTLIEKHGPVRFWRTHRKMSAAALAGAAGISAGYLSEIETGKKPGTIDVMKRLAELLNVTLNDLAG